MARPKVAQPRTKSGHIKLTAEQHAALAVVQQARGLKAWIHVLYDLSVKDAVVEAKRIRKALGTT